LTLILVPTALRGDGVLVIIAAITGGANTLVAGYWPLFGIAAGLTFLMPGLSALVLRFSLPWATRPSI
jgi:hypothetical protein